MKKLIVASLAMFAFAACNNSSNTPSEINETTASSDVENVGGQKDEHGCLTSAGETWSQLKQSCIQVFNEGIRLNPIENNGNTTIIAFILWKDDSTQVEVFLPEKKYNNCFG